MAVNRISLMDLIEATNDNDDDEQPTLFQPSPYYNTQSAIDLLKDKSNMFTVLSLNCQSLCSKIEELRIYLNIFENYFRFSAICIQETWLSDNADLSLLQIDGYNLISRGKSSSTHGGVAIYLRENFSYTILDINSETNVFDGLFIEIVINESIGKKLILGNLYRPPRNIVQNYETFSSEFDQILTNFQRTRHEVVICGDFNMDLLQIQNRQIFHEYFENLLSNGFVPKITFPTRISKNSSTLIDNILVKISDNFSITTSGILLQNISDHQPCFISLDYLRVAREKRKFIKIAKRSPEAMLSLKNELFHTCDLNEFHHSLDCDPNLNYDILHNKICEAIDKHIPSKTVKYNKRKHKNSRWITTGLVNSINFRDKLYNRMKSTPVDNPLYATLKTNLLTYNKILKQNIRQAKKLYFQSCFSKFRNDIKNTWLTIKDILNKSKSQKHLSDTFWINGNKVNDSKTVANEFNSFFINIGQSLAANIASSQHRSFEDYLSNRISSEFNFELVDCSTVKKVVNDLKPKSSCGTDGISNILLKNILNEIVDPLTLIINQSLTTGLFPNKLKIAKVIPLHKKDDDKFFKNYRPISILPSISKVLERIMHNQLHNYFQKENLYFSSQYGFRESHSTEFAALELVDRITTAMDHGETPLNIYLDLSKAFDTIDHNILLQKLSYYGIKRPSLQLLKDYLSERKQFVDYNGVHSDLLNITTGVPQGSILGPLLFIIYINDIKSSSNIFHPIIYADDTTLTTTLNSFLCDNINICLNKELVNISQWLKANKLTLNVNKTKAMIFHTSRRRVTAPDINIDGVNIDWVDHFDFLGIVIDKHLTWNQHIDKITTKLSRTIAVMNRLKHFVPSDILLTIYHSLILPHFNYGLLSWGSKCYRLNKLQKKAVRIIVNASYNAHSEPILKGLKLLKVQDICSLQELKLCFKFESGLLPNYFYSICSRHSDNHDFSTRNSNNFQLPLIKLSLAKFSVRYRLPIAYNNCPNIIKEKIYTHSYQGFTNYIKNHTLNKYLDNCSRRNCYICCK